MSKPSPESSDVETRVAELIADELRTTQQLHEIPNRILVEEPLPAPLNATKFRFSLSAMLAAQGFALHTTANKEPMPHVLLRLETLRLMGGNPELSLLVQWGPRAGYSVELQQSDAGMSRNVVSRL